MTAGVSVGTASVTLGEADGGPVGALGSTVGLGPSVGVALGDERALGVVVGASLGVVVGVALGVAVGAAGAASETGVSLRSDQLSK